MDLLNKTIKNIRPLDKTAVIKIRSCLAEKMTNDAGLGALRDILTSYVGITGSSTPAVPEKCTIVCCADHGVSAMKVSAYPPETTVHMTENYLISRGAVANALASFSGSDLHVVDMGIAASVDELPGLIKRKIAPGTKNCAVGPAMTREQATTAVTTGIQLADAYVDQGYHCFLPGEMGIANTTSSAAIVATFCALSPEKATGRGTNISDERLKVKIDVVRQVLAVNKPDPNDGLDVLAKVGGFELGCIAGIILGAAARRSFVVLDGFNTGAAALIAHALCPIVHEYLMGSHLAAEPAHGAILTKLQLKPYMNMKFRLGEATGSSIAVNLLDAAVLAYKTLAIDKLPEYPMIYTREMSVGTASPIDCEACTREILPLDQKSMAACQLRIDNLCKPIYSLGCLESIAVKLAGILHSARPAALGRALLCFTGSEGLSTTQTRLTAAFAKHAAAKITVAKLLSDCSADEAFTYGFNLAAKISVNCPLIGIATTETSPNDACGKKSIHLRQALCCEDGSLCYDATTFLDHVPSSLKTDAAAMMGAMVGAAHNRSLVILDNETTEIIARYTELLYPVIKPYFLHTQPALLDLGMTTGGGCIASLGIKIVDAALHMLNDMKTFAEARVAVADDGPGAGRQIK